MNLLTEPVFTADAGALSLPGVLAASARCEITGFPRLRAHQRIAWHTFRVQLAALALRKAGLAEPPAEPDAWADLLRALTAGDDSPWHLVTERSQPAFMQPADPGGLRWETVTTPDALDMLITARNHDLKSAIAEMAHAEDWVYALITLQTSEGYGGRGRYGIARMNGGSSSRPFLGLAPAASGGAADLSTWWRRDVAVLLRMDSDTTPLSWGGEALLWCLPWPEGEKIPAYRLDPFAIEVCRRVRLVEHRGQLSAARTGSAKPRVEADTFKGALGDPWTPITLTEDQPKALTLGEGKFDYRRIVDLLLLGNWTIPPAARVNDGEVAGEMVLVAEALSRGNSKTDGLKSRTLPLPKRGQIFLRDAPALLAEAAAEQIQEVAVADRALREAVALYAAGGDREKVGKDQRVRATPARARLDAAADAIFFDHLWDRAAQKAGESGGDTAVARFRNYLAETARAELKRAFEAIPCASINAPRARVRARARLEGLIRQAALVESSPAQESPDA